MNTPLRRSTLIAFILISLCAPLARAAGTIRVGSKNFTEQEILAHIVAQLIERTTDLNTNLRLGLGGTDICHAALLNDQLDVYVEYTGTGLLNVLKQPVTSNPAAAYTRVARAYRDRYDLQWLTPIGFNNTYAIAVRTSDATQHNWTSISDLAPHADDLRAGFTAEFMERPDGYPGLRTAYNLRFGSAIDLEPGLMYEALAQGQVDAICAFATDGRIAEYNLTTLIDDRAFFPPYDAAPIIRIDTLEAHPQLHDTFALLAGAITDQQMRQMNHAVDVQRRQPRDVASEWLSQLLGDDHLASTTDTQAPGAHQSVFDLAITRRAMIRRKTVEHLILTVLGTSIAVILGLPLGILIHRRAATRGPVLALAEIMQTIPSLAMLAFLFAIYGLLGILPATTALVLYALLPIVLNTFTGLREVPDQVIEAARGVGMSDWQRLRIVELPLAAPVIVAGIRAATVLTVGIATLSTYIGAGGLGDFIARGLARNDTRLTLLGAVPAALMAVTLSLLIRLFEKKLSKR